MKEKGIWRKLYEWDPIGPGKFLDGSTYRGSFRALGIFIISTYIMWYSYDFLAWCRWIFDIPYEINRGKQSWARVWAVIIGGPGILTAIASIIVFIPLKRYRARKSAEGQWFDHPDLTREELYEEVPEPSPEPERNVRPEKPEADGYWKEESTATHLIVEPAVPKNTVGNLRLERHEGRPVLIVPSSKDS
ncbi:MAG: hypothetical protein ACOZCK_14415 [Pseudomonadota bacterium]|jgi:hypothetical protein